MEPLLDTTTGLLGRDARVYRSTADRPLQAHVLPREWRGGVWQRTRIQEAEGLVPKPPDSCDSEAPVLQERPIRKREERPYVRGWVGGADGSPALRVVPSRAGGVLSRVPETRRPRGPLIGGGEDRSPWGQVPRRLFGLRACLRGLQLLESRDRRRFRLYKGKE